MAFSPLYGIDSAQDSRALWAPVQAALPAGRALRYWLRYLCAIPSVSTAVSIAEIQALHSHGLAAGLVWNGETAASVNGTGDQGARAGAAACAAARALGAPPTTVLWLDIESGWAPTVGYLHAYSVSVLHGGYRPGYYANCQAGTTGGDLFLRAYADAHSQWPGLHAQDWIWTSEPEGPGGQPLSNPVPAWNPAYPPSNAARTVLWQFREGSQGGIVDENLLSPVAYDAEVLWNPPAPPPTPPGSYIVSAATTGRLVPATDAAGVADLAAGTVVASVAAETPNWREVRLADGRLCFVPKGALEVKT